MRARGARPGGRGRQRGRSPPPGARQLEQGKGVPPGLGDDPVADPGVHRALDHRVQQPTGVLSREAAELDPREAGEVALGGRLAERDDNGDPFGQEPTRDERQRLGRDAVKPLRVVDQADQRLLLGAVSQQVQHGKSDQEAIRGLAEGQAERRTERKTLRIGEAVQSIQERTAELVQAGVRSSISASTPAARATRQPAALVST